MDLCRRSVCIYDRSAAIDRSALIKIRLKNNICETQFNIDLCRRSVCICDGSAAIDRSALIMIRLKSYMCEI